MIIDVVPKVINSYKKQKGPYLCFYNYEKNIFNRKIVEKIESLEKNFLSIYVVKMDWLEHKKYFNYIDKEEYNRVTVYSNGETLFDYLPPNLETDLINMFKKCQEIYEHNNKRNKNMYIMRSVSSESNSYLSSLKQTILNNKAIQRDNSDIIKIENIDVSKNTNNCRNNNIHLKMNLSETERQTKNTNNILKMTKKESIEYLIFKDTIKRRHDVFLNNLYFKNKTRPSKTFVNDDFLKKWKCQKKFEYSNILKSTIPNIEDIYRSVNDDILKENDKNKESNTPVKRISKRKLYTPIKKINVESKCFIPDKMFIISL